MRFRGGRRGIALPLFAFRNGLTGPGGVGGRGALGCVFVSRSRLPPEICGYLGESGVRALLSLLGGDRRSLVGVGRLHVRSMGRVLGVLRVGGRFRWVWFFSGLLSGGVGVYFGSLTRSVCSR